MTTRTTLFLGFFIGIIAIGLTSSLAHAAAPLGWLWGGTPDNTGAYQGAGWISLNGSNSGSGGGSYGVTIPSGNGNLSGYAWSPYYGWLSFNQSDLAGCPSGTCVATRSGSTFTGWAKFLALSGVGGMNGWVSLSGPGYGIGTGNSYGWSSDLGWIDLSGLASPAGPTVQIQFQ